MRDTNGKMFEATGGDRQQRSDCIDEEVGLAVTLSSKAPDIDSDRDPESRVIPMSENFLFVGIDGAHGETNKTRRKEPSLHAVNTAISGDMGGGINV